MTPTPGFYRVYSHSLDTLRVHMEALLRELTVNVLCVCVCGSVTVIAMQSARVNPNS